MWGLLNFRVPLNGKIVVNSPYGDRLHPIYKVIKFHSGIDYDASLGTPVVASERGRVIRAKFSTKMGDTIVIDHTPNTKKRKRYIYTMYNHLDGYEAKFDDFVEQGGVIGWSGNTGTESTGPHLHFVLVDSPVKIDWKATGLATGVPASRATFKNAENYYNITIDVDGTIDDFTQAELDKLADSAQHNFKEQPYPMLTLDFPSYGEFMRRLGRGSISMPKSRPRVDLEIDFKNGFSRTFKAIYPRVNLVVDGQNLGRIPLHSRNYKVQIWG